MPIPEGRRHPAQEPSQHTLLICSSGIDMLIERSGVPLYEGRTPFCVDPLLYTEVNLRYAVSVVKETMPVPSRHFATKIVRVRQAHREEGSDRVMTRRQSFYFYENPDQTTFAGAPAQRVDMVEDIEPEPFPATLEEIERYKKHLILVERDLYAGNLEASAEAAETEAERLAACTNPEEREKIEKWGVPIGSRGPAVEDPALSMVFTGLELSLSFSLHRD